MLVETVAKLLHDALPHAVGDIGLEHADRARDDRDRHHDRDQDLQQRQVHRQQHRVPIDDVGGEEGNVEDHSDEHRIHHAGARRDDHQEGNGRHTEAVLLEEPRGLADELSVGDAPRRLLAFDAAETASVHHGWGTPGHARHAGVIASTVPSCCGFSDLVTRMDGPFLPLSSAAIQRGGSAGGQQRGIK